MENKIYEKVKEEGRKSYEKVLHELGIICEKDHITDQTPKKNIDLFIILSKLDLIEANSENSKIIDEFYDYLFKLGIDIGVGAGEKIMIEAIQNDEIDFKELMELNPEEIVSFDYVPKFFSDLMEAIENEN